MRPSTSILSRYANRLFGTARWIAPQRRGNRRRAHGPLCIPSDVLEVRALLSGTTFGSALSIGNDTGPSAATDVTTDAAGNRYMTGSFSGTVDFDQANVHAGDTDILTALGSADAFVAKYAADNSLLWVQRMGGDVNTPGIATDSGGEIATDGAGNVYVVGNFTGTGDFGSTTLASAGSRDGFVTKLNASGTVQWAKSWGTSADDGFRGVGVDSAGNVYALGTRNRDSYNILKFNSTGSTVWSKSIATHQVVTTGDLAVDATGNVFVAGSFNGNVDFDPGSKTYNVYSGGAADNNWAGFVLKLDKNGKFSWVSPFVGKTVGSTVGNAWVDSIVLDGSGSVVVGGAYRNTVDFNPGSGTYNLPTIGGGYIAKLNSSGGLLWARALESNGPANVQGLDVDAAGNIYATGYFRDAVDLNPGAGSDTRTSAGEVDIFVVKLTAAGNYSWAETFGGTGSDYGYVSVDASGAVHLAGSYEGTVDFNSDPWAAYELTTAFRNGFLLELLQV